MPGHLFCRSNSDLNTSQLVHSNPLGGEIKKDGKMKEGMEGGIEVGREVGRDVGRVVEREGGMEGGMV